MVWHSVRAKGETKTRKSRRTLALPTLAVDVLKQHGEEQNIWRGKTDKEWREDDLVFCSDTGGALDAANVRREFRNVAGRAGLDPKRWVPRELRHSFVSLLSDRGMSSDQISKSVGHSSTTVTETVYRHQIRPVVQGGAVVMDQIFPAPDAA
jgi:integrase